MITSKHIDAQGNVALWEATDDGRSKVMLPATDAAHALQADPDRWSLVDPDDPERSASEFGGESVAGAMDPGPQPGSDSAAAPAPDDASKQESGE